MANVTITEAARLAGISRQYLYTKYIKPGVLSVKKDNDGKPYIDTSELLRAFNGRLPGPKEASTEDTKDATSTFRKITVENDIKNAALQAEVEALREAMMAARTREAWLQGKVDELTAQVATAHRLLEHKSTIAAAPLADPPPVADPPADPPPAADPPQEQKRGFFGRLFGRK